VLVRWAVNKLSTLPPDRWVRWTHRFLEILAEGTTEVEYCDFLEELLCWPMSGSSWRNCKDAFRILTW
jgi:hypothetical protein